MQNLKIIDLQQPDFLRTLENSVQFGNPVLLQNVQEELDPSLGPILNKSLIKKGNRVIIKLGDKEVDFNPDFKFYITTKLSNPHYTPEISTKTVIVNFAVKEQGEAIVTQHACIYYDGFPNGKTLSHGYGKSLVCYRIPL